MGTYSFNAFAFGGELDLNRLAIVLGISRKYRWEEPMKLNPVTFASAMDGDAERVYLFYFGCAVFLNCSGDIVARFLDGIKQHVDVVKIPPQLAFREEYQLEIDPTRECSASGFDYDSQAALEAGAKGIILKPFVPKEIYESVKKVLGGK